MRFKDMVVISALLAALCLLIPSTSQAGFCGDSIVDADEQCDDGNQMAGDGCFRCVIECEADPECPSGIPCDPTIKLCTENDCLTHCHCPQGSFCYHGTCLSDPEMPVYCCGKEGCPPGRWCFELGGGKDTCAESDTHVCESACDCGAAHACKEIPGYDGKRCVKDVNDPWDPGGVNIFEHLGVTVVRGEDATYCCEDPLCHAGKFAFGDEPFLCERPPAYPGGPTSVSQACGGALCTSACQCDPGESCIDNDGYDNLYYCEAHADCPEGSSCNTSTNSCWPPMGKICDWAFKLGPKETSASCVSNAVAEAVYGYSPSELLPCCSKGCFSGQKCEVGWQQGGGYLLERVIGVCGGSCGNESCDPGESQATCPSDCYPPPPYPDCGEMSCGYTGHYAMCGDGICDTEAYTPENCMICSQDCGPATNSDDDYWPDCLDNCPDEPSDDQTDTDSDGLGDVCDPDVDGDGVINDLDICAATPNGDVVSPESGCSIAQLCPCEGPRGTTVPWNNHGKYVSCTAHAASDFVAQGLITEAQKDAIISAAGGSSCGDKE